ncbi:Heterokaryon incompatibility protein (HET) domain containing protein [Rhypophila sp. PSN 637]
MGQRPALRHLRVIDCFSRRIVSFLEQIGDYVTLSYVWGTTTNTYPVSSTAVPQRVPKVVADVMSMTRRLGFRYLWIDRYCIPHDDAQQRHDQVHSMDSIYAGSTLTLIAAAGNWPEDGLAGVDGSPRRRQLRLQVREHILTYLRDFKSEFDASTWKSRGWTFQEGLFAKRRLVFGESEAYFECASMHCFESISIPLKEVHDARGVMYSVVQPWRLFSVVENIDDPSTLLSRIDSIMHRHLTFEKDVLNAAIGVFAYDRKLDPSARHLFGLPLFLTRPLGPELLCGDSSTPATIYLALAIGWSISCDKDRALPGPILRRRGFPSWTWAGWKHEIGHDALSRTYWYVGSWRSLGLKLGTRDMQDRRLRCHFPLHIEIIMGVVQGPHHSLGPVRARRHGESTTLASRLDLCTRASRSSAIVSSCCSIRLSMGDGFS